MSLTTLFFYSFTVHVVLLSCMISPESLGLVTAATTFAGNETDRLALLAFKAEITRDPSRVMSSWNESVHFCQWQGVACGRRHPRVTAMTLQSLGLVGSISPYVGNLSFLQELRLQNNSFHGQIPPELGGLFRLQVLRLAVNLLDGQIPANLSRCSNLVELRLGTNKLVGNIPVELGRLSKLEQLVLQINNLTGEIPPSLGNISSLAVIGLGINKLEGRIPDEIGRLKGLTVLRIGENQLSGMIPPSVYNLSSITDFVLVQNQLQGSLPDDIGITLPNLRILNIGSNQFSGHVPVSLSNASALEELDVGVNNFTGKVSLNFGRLENFYWLNMGSNRLGSGGADDLGFITSLTNCSKLTVLAIFDNLFGGEFPISITNLTIQLTGITMGRNQIYGRIPEEIENLVNLDTLGMEANLLTGKIPSSIGKLQKLQALALFLNKLSGEIPSSLGNLTAIEIDLGRNNLQGNIPPSLGNCRNLLRLELSENNLSGRIPREVLNLPSLSIYLGLSRNTLNGSLPVEVGNLRNLMYLDVSENNLSSEIPSSIGGCTVLEHLHMEGNSFRGSIPSTLFSLKGIRDLDLSRNNLAGQIPRYFQDMSLTNLNLSSNNLEGEVPVGGVFLNASAVSVAGNSKLCGGISELQLPMCITEKPKKKRGMSRALKIIIPIVSGLVGLTLLLSILILYWFKEKKKEEPSSPNSSSLQSLLNISYERLLRGTEGFSSTNLIGVGSYGSVYKGVLDQDGSVVAVKVLNLQHRGASKSFMAECEVLKNIRHRNLVKILTACSSVDFRGNEFKALVYEFMPNGSLERWLYPITELGEESRKLNLLQRLNIVIDVVWALDYLHCRCQTPIVHCDLKPSNVLLDNDLIAHVGDFGLARFLQQANDQNALPNQSSTVGIKGSIGYAAPEYGMGSEISTNGDVYSYGILLLEIFTAKRPTDEMFKDGLNLHTFVKMALPDQVMEVVDPMVLSTEDEEEEEAASNGTKTQRQMRRYRVQECLSLILGLGVACSVESPRERMDITGVANQLQAIKESFLKNH